jgi:hypothetical protein
LEDGESRRRRGRETLKRRNGESCCAPGGRWVGAEGAEELLLIVVCRSGPPSPEIPLLESVECGDFSVEAAQIADGPCTRGCSAGCSPTCRASAATISRTSASTSTSSVTVTPVSALPSRRRPPQLGTLSSPFCSADHMEGLDALFTALMSRNAVKVNHRIFCSPITKGFLMKKYRLVKPTFVRVVKEP